MIKKLFLILVLAIVAFSAFTSATPTNFKRESNISQVTKTGTLVSRRLQCPNNFKACPDMSGCCPTGTKCLRNNKCNVPCPSNAKICSNGACCIKGSTCTSDGRCVIR
ncbi:hypothetical protein RhiirA5_362391 [Rhizophagus irregularis]|uniref:Uncharacterized protein n=1 Tax=Rhizophagus irregularis TaxID=588596 RepID=A0A2I1EH77_9GLOM|nr:hypothetical protein RhiirA5_362391 [Rhizophagus irregularis]PKC63729.1 hypothetical protein RhiirA1_422414 [Rhizophagus irregularis]PKY21485.1 hypothetical protein RhiirB3_409494 [Rhizophagus irregularis]CAB5362350.1 unnamed protein product [Rhizophagus irregularis]